MTKPLLAALILAAVGLALPAEADEQPCDPAYLNFFKGSGGGTTQADHQDMAGRCFDAIDSDDDNVVSGEEWDDYHSRLFDGMDLDGDGTASQDEIQRTLSWE